MGHEGDFSARWAKGLSPSVGTRMEGKAALFPHSGEIWANSVKR